MRSVACRTLRGRIFYLPINPDTVCRDLKPEICKKLNIQTDDLTLFFRSKKLKDDKNVMNLNLKKTDFITVHQGDSFFNPILKEQISKSYPRATEGTKVPTYEEFHNIESVYDKNVNNNLQLPEENTIELIDGDPSDFVAKVKELAEYQFPQDKIIELLRKYNYDSSIVLDILVSGKEPKQAPAEVIHDVSDLGRYDFGDFSIILDEFTNKEKFELLTLCRTHPDPMNIIQIYCACDKNIEAAEHALVE